MRGEQQVLGGSLMTTMQGAVNGVLPDAVRAAAHRVMARPRS